MLLDGGPDLTNEVAAREPRVVLMGEGRRLPQDIVPFAHRIDIPFTDATVTPMLELLFPAIQTGKNTTG